MATDEATTRERHGFHERLRQAYAVATGASDPSHGYQSWFAERIGVTARTIRKWGREYPAPSRAWLWLEAIEDMIDRSDELIDPPRPGGPKPERDTEIRRLARAGVRYEEIALRFDLSVSRIYQIVEAGSDTETGGGDGSGDGGRS